MPTFLGGGASHPPSASGNDPHRSGMAPAGSSTSGGGSHHPSVGSSGFAPRIKPTSSFKKKKKKHPRAATAAAAAAAPSPPPPLSNLQQLLEEQQRRQRELRHMLAEQQHAQHQQHQHQQHRAHQQPLVPAPAPDLHLQYQQRLMAMQQHEYHQRFQANESEIITSAMRRLHHQQQQQQQHYQQQQQHQAELHRQLHERRLQLVRPPPPGASQPVAVPIVSQSHYIQSLAAAASRASGHPMRREVAQAEATASRVIRGATSAQPTKQPPPPAITAAAATRKPKQPPKKQRPAKKTTRVKKKRGKKITVPAAPRRAPAQAAAAAPVCAEPTPSNPQVPSFPTTTTLVAAPGNDATLANDARVERSKAAVAATPVASRREEALRSKPAARVDPTKTSLPPPSKGKPKETHNKASKVNKPSSAVTTSAEAARKPPPPTARKPSAKALPSKTSSTSSSVPPSAGARKKPPPSKDPKGKESPQPQASPTVSNPVVIAAASQDDFSSKQVDSRRKPPPTAAKSKTSAATVTKTSNQTGSVPLQTPDEKPKALPKASDSSRAKKHSGQKKPKGSTKPTKSAPAAPAAKKKQTRSKPKRKKSTAARKAPPPQSAAPTTPSGVRSTQNELDRAAETLRGLSLAPTYPVGTRTKKYFRKYCAWFPGIIRSYNAETNLYSVEYEDGDREDLEPKEIKTDPLPPSKYESGQKFNNQLVSRESGEKLGWFVGTVQSKYYERHKWRYVVVYNDGDSEDVAEDYIAECIQEYSGRPGRRGRPPKSTEPAQPPTPKKPAARAPKKKPKQAASVHESKSPSEEPIEDGEDTTESSSDEESSDDESSSSDDDEEEEHEMPDEYFYCQETKYKVKVPRWTAKQHYQFLRGIREYGLGNLEEIHEANCIPTRGFRELVHYYLWWKHHMSEEGIQLNYSIKGTVNQKPGRVFSFDQDEKKEDDVAAASEQQKSDAEESAEEPAEKELVVPKNLRSNLEEGAYWRTDSRRGKGGSEENATGASNAGGAATEEDVVVDEHGFHVGPWTEADGESVAKAYANDGSSYQAMSDFMKTRSPRQIGHYFRRHKKRILEASKKYPRKGFEESGDEEETDDSIEGEEDVARVTGPWSEDEFEMIARAYAYDSRTYQAMSDFMNKTRSASQISKYFLRNKAKIVKASKKYPQKSALSSEEEEVDEENSEDERDVWAKSDWTEREKEMIALGYALYGNSHKQTSEFMRARSHSGVSKCFGRRREWIIKASKKYQQDVDDFINGVPHSGGWNLLEKEMVNMAVGAGMNSWVEVAKRIRTRNNKQVAEFMRKHRKSILANSKVYEGYEFTFGEDVKGLGLGLGCDEEDNDEEENEEEDIINPLAHKEWTHGEKSLLVDAVAMYGDKNDEIAAYLKSRPANHIRMFRKRNKGWITKQARAKKREKDAIEKKTNSHVWTAQEQSDLSEAHAVFGTDWERIARYVQTRDAGQVESYLQAHAAQFRDEAAFDLGDPFAFPIELFHVLNVAPFISFDHILSWNEDGNAVIVHDDERFAELVFPRYSFAGTSPQVFYDKLNFFGFKESTESDGQAQIFKHPLFQKDDMKKVEALCRKPFSG